MPRMNLHLDFMSLAVIALGLLLLLTVFVARLRSRSQFVRKRFLTDCEARVLGYLETALPEHRVMAQVAMGALLQAGKSDRKQAQATRNRFAQKIVDFAIVTRNSAEVLALVELDDRTHRAAKDRMRDEMTAAAGYRTIRIPGRPAPTLESVKALVAGLGQVPAEANADLNRGGSSIRHAR